MLILEDIVNDHLSMNPHIAFVVIVDVLTSGHVLVDETEQRIAPFTLKSIHHIWCGQDAMHIIVGFLDRHCSSSTHH
jgi:hypothetical protein